MKVAGFKLERGVVLIEALLAAVVLAVGFLALTALEGRITLTVSGDKARAEAMEIAKDRSEELAVLVVTHQFDSLTASTSWNSDASVTGKNATFSPRWRITDDSSTLLESMKFLEVEVNWVDSKGDTQRVMLVTNIATKPLYASTATPQSGYGQVSSPNAGAAEYIDPAGLDLDPDTTPEHEIERGGEIIEVRVEDDIDIDADGDNDTVVWELKEDGTITVLGIYTDPITIEGTVYFDGAIDEIYVFSSDAGYCAFPLNPSGSADANGYESAKYKCYLGSGWRGKIGVLGFTSATPLLCPYISRMYVKYEIDADGDIVGHEGIDRSYGLDEHHDFIIRDSNSGTPTCESEQALYYPDYVLDDSDPPVYTAVYMAPALIVGNDSTGDINVYSITGTFTKRGGATDADALIERVYVESGPDADGNYTYAPTTDLGSCITGDDAGGDGLWTCTIKLPLDAGNTVALRVNQSAADLLSRVDVDPRLNEVTLADDYDNSPVSERSVFFYDLSGLATNVAVGPDITIRR